MINSNSIAFDIDSVVADTMSLFFEIAEKEYNIKGLSLEDITSYNLEECLDVELDTLINIFDRIMRGDYDDYSLKPYVGAPEVIKRLSENGGQVLFITARSVGEPIHDWISKISSTPAGKIEVIATGSFEGKIDFLLEKNIKYFVEDRLET
ncbi:MAG: haloacid dehalogenase, partial [bacterium]|nr:haloacid dehalogenase [bacterium]